MVEMTTAHVYRRVQRGFAMSSLQMSVSSRFCLMRSLLVPMMPDASGKNVSFGLQPSTRLLLRRILSRLRSCL